MAETEKQKDIYILGIESSCDETAASVVKNGREVLSNVISSQIALHTLYGGVVPEIASRCHIEAISRLTRDALEEAGVTLLRPVITTGEDGTIEPAGGGYYDLSDTEFLQQAAEEAVDSGRQNGVLTDSHLRFLRLDTDSGSTIVFADTSNETQTLTGLFRTCLLLCSAAFIAF